MWLYRNGSCAKNKGKLRELGKNNDMTREEKYKAKMWQI